jgi:ketosteroid isomerase-like protein
VSPHSTVDKPVELLLRRCYAAFNARDLDGAVATMHPDVSWPNGWEGGWVEGREGVRRYWERQWAAIDPHVEPRAFREEPDGRITVEVHQMVRDLSGNVLADQMVEHVYQFHDGCIRRMDIRK